MHLFVTVTVRHLISHSVRSPFCCRRISQIIICNAFGSDKCLTIYNVHCRVASDPLCINYELTLTIHLLKLKMMHLFRDEADDYPVLRRTAVGGRPGSTYFF